MAEHDQDVDDLQGEIQELFADLWQVPRFAGLRHGFRPACDCFRTEEPPTLHLVLDLAGADPDRIQVLVAGRSVVVAGTRERPESAGALYHALEIEYGDFRRRVELLEDVDPAHASARFERGLLRIDLPVVARRPSQERVQIVVMRG
jgi:HSP20 family molecular chaperone IbpA